MIWFCYFRKKKKNCCFVLAVTHGDPIFPKVGPKNRDFFQCYWIPIDSLHFFISLTSAHVRKSSRQKNKANIICVKSNVASAAAKVWVELEYYLNLESEDFARSKCIYKFIFNLYVNFIF